jgi:hypothetical protein
MYFKNSKQCALKIADVDKPDTLLSSTSSNR